MKEVERELTVDVMELVAVLAIGLLQMFRIDLVEVMQIIGTMRVHTFVDTEEFPVFLRNQGMATIRTFQAKRLFLTGREGMTAHLAEPLPMRAIVHVNEGSRSTAAGTGAAVGNLGGGSPVADWRHGLAVALAVIILKGIAFPFLVMLNHDRQLIDLELLVLGRMGSIPKPLSQRDKLDDEAQKPADDGVLVLDKLE